MPGEIWNIRKEEISMTKVSVDFKKHFINILCFLKINYIINMAKVVHGCDGFLLLEKGVIFMKKRLYKSSVDKKLCALYTN